MERSFWLFLLLEISLLHYVKSCADVVSDCSAANESLIMMDDYLLFGPMEQNLEFQEKDSEDYVQLVDILDTLVTIGNASFELSKITELTKDFFYRMKCVRIIDLSCNNLTVIEDMAFNGLSNLERLDLSYNNLTGMDFFRSECNDSLIELDLSFNRIKHLDEVFIQTLSTLNLSNNEISIVACCNFLGLPKLTELDLSMNVIEVLGENCFSFLDNLKRLHLQGNRLSEIPPGIFKYLQTLEFLDLSKNSFSKFGQSDFNGLWSLLLLDISFNNLKTLSGNILKLSTIQSLLLNHNLVTDLDIEDVLINLADLKVVSLEDNPWNCSSISKIVRACHSKRVTVNSGTSFNVENVLGIPCKIDSDPYSSCNQLDINVSNLILDRLRFYFNDEFKTSKFYDALNNTLDDSTFVRAFQEAFRNTSFFQYFDKEFLNTTPFREIDSYNVRTNIRQYFQNKDIYEACYRKSFCNTNYLDDIMNNAVLDFFHYLRTNYTYSEGVYLPPNQWRALFIMSNFLTVLSLIMLYMYISDHYKYRKVLRRRTVRAIRPIH